MTPEREMPQHSRWGAPLAAEKSTTLANRLHELYVLCHWDRKNTSRKIARQENCFFKKELVVQVALRLRYGNCPQRNDSALKQRRQRLSIVG